MEGQGTDWKGGEKKEEPDCDDLKKSQPGDVCRLNLKQLVQQDAGDKLKRLVDFPNCPESRFKGWLTDLLTDWQASRIKSILCLCSKSSSVVQPVGQKGSFPHWHTKNNLKQHYCRRNMTQINTQKRKTSRMSYFKGKNASTNDWKMFLGLLKPIQIKYKK